MVAEHYKTKRVIAEDGGHSRKHQLLGETGSDVIINVPQGITVSTDEGVVLADLCNPKDSTIVARGGMGGRDSNNFLGVCGDRRSVRLDLKLLGDVGFVGFPNAGKSTLLKALSNARPKIASYPFTTIKPNLGVCDYDDSRRISFADLPGLIEGAHQNLGMGHAFLKHVERTRVLMFVIDITGFQFKVDSPLRSALETILILNKELELYKDDLLDKPAICVISKMDTNNAPKAFETLKQNLNNIEALMQDEHVISPEFVPERLIRFSDVIPVSAKYSPKSIDHLKCRIRDIIDYYEQEKNAALMDKLGEKVDTVLSEKSVLT